jgi:ribosomal protein S18 acetylase RimI-like enzyme
VSGPSTFSIAPATSARDVAAVQELFRAYAASLPVDLGYQGFATELAGLPGKYAPPDGALLLATSPEGAAAGCVALRRLDAPESSERAACEMKRLYLVPEARGSGLGRALAEAIIAEARRLGYREMRLDSLPSMGAAIALYRRLGFVDIAPYYDTPVEGTTFLAFRLDRQEPAQASSSARPFAQ